MILIGFLAGTASWAVIELLFYFGESIKYHILWNSLAGASIGLFFGLFFGSAEGIILSDFKRSLRGAVSGSLMGLAAGALVVLLAQGFLSYYFILVNLLSIIFYGIVLQELLSVYFLDYFLAVLRE